MTTLIAKTPATRGPLDPAAFSAIETLRHRQEVEIRALRAIDEDGLKAAIAHISSRSLYRRFFGHKRHFTEKETAYFMNVDFVAHVALVAIVGGRIIGGSRYIVVRPGIAELAFAVIDEYQGQGLGAALLRHLISLARAAGLTQFVADVMPDNDPMLAVFAKSGLRVSTRREHGRIALTFDLADAGPGNPPIAPSQKSQRTTPP
jgi:GNAT superfamily N-acetyltransferase